MKHCKRGTRIVLMMLVLIFTLCTTAGVSAQAAKIKLSKKKLTLTVGEKRTLVLKKGSKKIKPKQIKWTTTNKNVAAVNKKGKITAKAAGKAVIFAQYGKKKYKCTVTVKRSVPARENPGKVDPGKEDPGKADPGKEDTKPADGKTDTKPSDGKEDTKPSDGKTDTKPADGKEDTKPTDGKEDTKPSDGKTDSKPTDEKPEKSDAFDPKTDMKVQMGSTMRTVSFKINKDVVTEEELKAAGYTVNGGVATKDTICETATYTFTKLPKTLEEIKSIPLNDRFAPMAASICAVAAFDDEKYGVSYMYSHPIFEMLDYLNGPAFEINNTQRSGIFLSMRDAVKGSYKNAYFDGANPENNYTPNTPYTFTLVESPYYIPAKSSTINYPSGTPERRMILIAFAGDDFQRYIDTYQSSDGNWYGWDNSWQHLVAEVKTMKGKDVTF